MAYDVIKHEHCLAGRREQGGTMRSMRTVAIVLAAATMVVCTGCRPTPVSTTRTGVPAVVIKTVKEEDSALRYSITAGYPQLRGHLTAAVTAKINAAIANMIMPDIAGLKQNAADDAAWAAKNPSEAAQLPLDQSNFLSVDYEIPYLTNDLISVRMRFDTYSAGAAHGMSFTRVLNVRLSDGNVIDTEGLFTDGKQGLQWLSQYCAADLRCQYGSDYDALKSFVDYGTTPVPENFTSVSLEPDGLVVSFDPYQVGPYAAGPREVRISVDKVQSMLAITLSSDAFSLVLEPRS
jgi:hypothetical protein